MEKNFLWDEVQGMFPTRRTLSTVFGKCHSFKPLILVQIKIQTTRFFSAKRRLGDSKFHNFPRGFNETQIGERTWPTENIQMPKGAAF